MERKLKIKVSNNKYTYGRMSGETSQPLFIVVHGLPGSMDEDLYFDAVRWFAKHGYATFRFNLYGPENNSRQLIDTTLETHASDIDAVVAYFRNKKFKHIFLAGHSYGALGTLLSKDQNFDGVVLWDPSYKVSFTKSEENSPKIKFLKEVNAYLMPWGTNFVIGKRMADEADALNWDALPKDFHIPLKIIAAQKGFLVQGAKSYFKHANTPKELDIFQGATHYFNDTETMRDNLFKVSNDWFRTLLKK